MASYHHWASREDVETLKLKKLTQWTNQELVSFMKMKEQVYSLRRQRIKQKCYRNPEYFSNGTSRMALIYDEKDKISYCAVPKIASSTWCWHFIQMANISQEEISKRHQVLQTFAPFLFPAPDPEDISEAWAETVSIVIVRHPLARLVSGYYQKFIKLAKHGTWAPKIKQIIEKYRSRPNKGDQVHPSPEEFIRYILDRLKFNRRQTDPHWRPQHLQCPYCLVDFTIYSKMEELEEDTIYFTAKSNLTDRLEIDLKRNSMRNNDRHVSQFWRQVSPRYTWQLGEDWAYGVDLEVFDYSLEKYFDDIGMSEYLDKF